MKRIIVILLLLLPLSVMAQQPFKGFFKPVPDNLSKTGQSVHQSGISVPLLR